MSVHGAAQQNVIAVRFIEEDVLLEWAKHDDEPPVAKTRMGKSGAWTKPRMLGEQVASSFDCSEVLFRDVPARIDRIPLKLAFHV